MLPLVGQIWQIIASIGWNGLTAIATLLSAIATLAIALDTWRRTPRSSLPPVVFPQVPQTKTSNKPRKRRHNRKRLSNRATR